MITRILANGFIVTSLIWASALAALIDRRLRLAAIWFLLAGGLALFGVIHSPLPGGRLFLPWQLDAAMQPYPLRFAVGYAVAAALLLVWGTWQNLRESRLPRSEESA
jgi:AGZA family xanthine/uracil permease-like MFS transporter